MRYWQGSATGMLSDNLPKNTQEYNEGMQARISKQHIYQCQKRSCPQYPHSRLHTPASQQQLWVI